MSIFIIMLILFLLYNIKFSFRNGFEDYMSPQKSNSIKGFFVLMVLLSHARKFIKVDSSPINAPFQDFMSFFGQMMVVMFLFYSGYGIMLGLKNKEGYAKSILLKRFPMVLIHFDIAVIIYYALSFFLEKDYSVKRFVLSLLGLSNVGNEVWFIFMTLILYLLTFSIFIIFQNKTVLGTVLMTVFTFLLVFIMIRWKGNDHWWYDTIMCYPLGMWYALAKPYIDKKLINDFNKWFSCTVSVGILFFFMTYIMDNYGRRMRYFIPAALLLGLFITLITMRVSFNNKILAWFGNHVFSIYILHYIPMRILAKLGLTDSAFLFTAISLAVTIVLAHFYEKAMNKLDVMLKLSKKR